jgi:DNA (cytosine-5)-methyltransferase 1
MSISCMSITSGFCGAGGDSQGADDAGAEVELAMNHNELALRTHAYNFPRCEHAQVNICAVNPKDFRTTRGLWMSPECRFQSTSSGVKLKGQQQLKLWPGYWTDNEELDEIQRSRMTMYEVHRWAEAKCDQGQPYDIIWVENVPKVVHWKYYQTWLADMTKLKYRFKILSLNSQFFGVAQSRDRWYAVFWRERNPAPDLEFRPRATCPYCEREIEAVQSWKLRARGRVGMYGKQYIYCCPRCANEVKPYTTPASTIIDWSIPTPKIKDRHRHPRLRPLKTTTLARIEAGLRRYCAGEMEEPFLVEVCRKRSKGALARRLNEPGFTQTTAQSVGLVLPPAFLVSYYSNGHACSLDAPIGTITSKDRYGLVQLPASTPAGAPPPVEECGFRMLDPEEVKLGMGFWSRYTILGTTEAERVAQCGRAVTPAVARALIERGMKSLS